MSDKIKPLLLVIERDIWKQFKSKVPKELSLNNAVVYLIEEFNNKEVNQNESQ